MQGQVNLDQVEMAEAEVVPAGDMAVKDYVAFCLENEAKRLNEWVREDPATR